MSVSTSLSSAAIYLDSLPREERRQGGQVYTPNHIVMTMLGWAGYEAALETPRTSLLDPACGGGAFLEGVVRLWAKHLAQAGEELATAAGRNALMRSVERTVFGIDVDPHGVRLAIEAVRGTVSRLCGGASLPSSFFRSNVVEGDFLLDPHPELLLDGVGDGFDFIVGNPPYVSTLRLSSGYKERLREHFVSASGRIDLYTVFMERGINLLKSGGTLSFITPDKYLASRTAQPLRALMLQCGAIRVIGRFRSHKVFDEAATVPCVTVFERDRRPGPVQLLDCQIPDRTATVRVVHRSKVPLSDLGASKGWRFTAPDVAKLERLIQGPHPQLRSRLRRLSAGIATGRDAIYVGREGSLDVEEALLVRAVRGRDLRPFAVSNPKLSMVVPYTFTERGRPTLIDLQRYPRARRFFGQHRKELESRHCVRVWEKAWYDLHDPMPFDLGRTPKILVPDVASHNRFVYDPGHYWPLHSVYYLVPDGIDAQFLTAVLNSSPIEFLIRLRAPVVKDGFSRYRKQFLEGLPVPEASVANRAAIIEAAAAGDRARCDVLVGRLFGLTADTLVEARDFVASLLKPAAE